MKLTLRFLILVVALLGAVGASALAGMLAITTLGDSFNGVVNGDMRRVLSITHARRTFRSMTLLERDYLLASSASERQALAKKIEGLGRELTSHLRDYEKTMPAEDRSAIAAIEACRARWLDLDARVLAAAEHDAAAALELSKQHQADPVSWETSIGALIKLSEQRLERRVQETNQTRAGARSTLLAVSALAAALSAALGSMIFFAIRRNLTELLTLNGELETRVRERTLEIAARERSLHLVLDSTGDALITTDLNGVVDGERSAAALAWFGAPKPGQRIWQYLQPENDAWRLDFQVSFEQLAADVMPWELSAEQMPAWLERGGRIFELLYLPIRDEGRLQRLLISARDITLRIRSEQAEHATREQYALISQLVRDKAGFAGFVQECDELFSRLRSATDPREQARHLHTLKGNVGQYGLTSVVQACHVLEERLEQQQRGPTSEEIASLWELWRTKFKSVDELLGSARRGTVEVDTAEHTHLVRSLVEHREYSEILGLVEQWTWSRSAVRLRRIATQADYVAQRLNKALRVHVVDNDVRMPEGYLETFWPTLTHVIRNAVDHGIEPSDERQAAGKPSSGQLWLETRVNGDELIVEVRDDGRGIDRQALRKRLQSRGFDFSERAPLEALLFRDGVSSRDEATEFSGRGVGLAASKQACSSEGGTLVVSSEPGRGTTFSFHFRRPLVAEQTTSTVLRRSSLSPAAPANKSTGVA